MKNGKCISCIHYDCRNGYCTVNGRDVNGNCGCKEHETLKEYQQRQEEMNDIILETAIIPVVAVVENVEFVPETAPVNIK